MPNDTIELVSSNDSPTGVAGRNVNGEFESFSPVPPITPEQLNSNEQPVDVPAVSPDTTTSGELARFEQGANTTDQFTQNLQQSAQSSGASEAKSFEDLIAFEASMPTENQLQNAAFSRDTGFGSVDELKATVTNYNNQIKAEQHALRREIERLEKNPGGLSSDQLADIIGDKERESIRKQADVAILQQSAMGNYQNALDIANRAIDAELSRQERDLNILGLIYDRNKSVFDKDEQRLFDARLQSRQSAIEAQRADAKQLQQTKLEVMKMAQTNGAPAEVLESIQKATDPFAVVAAGGQYGSTDMLDRAYKRAQIASIYDTINARSTAARKAALEAETKQEAEEEQRKADTEQALGIRELALQLQTDPGMSATVGFGFKKSLVGAIPFVSGDAVAGTSRADYEATATRLANMLTLDNLDLMSGVLSETDIKILESAGSNLKNYDQSEEQYRKEIQRVLDVANRTIEENGLSREQAVFWGMVEPTDYNEIESIYGSN